jgi:N-acetylglutamate synthase-like GNAT family acetyltransferase
MAEPSLFQPGAYWTPERSQAAVGAMLAKLAEPTFQAMLSEAAGEDGGRGAGADGFVPLVRSPGPVTLEACVFRRGRPEDVPQLGSLMAAADLPPLFIEEFLGGFAVVEHAGEVLGGGGLEPYDGCGVIRSVVVDEGARGLGLGRRIAALLTEDARLSGLEDLYLFTAEAHGFWLTLGFKDVELDAWKPAPRASWQYQFIAAHKDEMPFQVHSMWRPA